jgi:hypothetical protein
VIDDPEFSRNASDEALEFTWTPQSVFSLEAELMKMASCSDFSKASTHGVFGTPRAATARAEMLSWLCPNIFTK